MPTPEGYDHPKCDDDRNVESESGNARIPVTVLLLGRTVSALDPACSHISVVAPGGREEETIPVIDSAIMKGIQVRDRVALEVNTQGMVVKIRKFGPNIVESHHQDD